MTACDLLSLVLTLRPRSAGEAPSHLGRAAHALLLDAVRASDPALAEELHAGSGPRPFTVSNLVGYSPRAGLDPGRTYTLRLTALTAPVTCALVATNDGAWTPRKPLAIGNVVRLAESEFRIEAVATDPTAHPWAATTAYESLSGPWLLARTEPERYIQLQFSSPTTFKSGGLHVPVPLAGWVVGSLLEKWNAFAPVALPEEARRFADECLALSSYRLSTWPVQLKDGGLRVGALGTARYTAIRPDRYWLSVVNLLADFALFAGVGAGTTMGLGQCRRIKDPRPEGRRWNG